MSEERTTTIGHSSEGRPIGVLIRGEATARRRVLIIAGQHGDEARAARLTRRWFETTTLPDDVAVACIATLNPDGCAARTRLTATGIDLNRDHVLLRAPETRACHAFVSGWAPHAVVDVHSFPSRRDVLLRRGLVLPWDVCIDTATHPACPPTTIADDVIDVLRAGGTHVHRYVRVTHRTVRHSTPRPYDARNGLALRHDLLSLLVELRAATCRDDEHARTQLRQALRRSLSAAVSWVAAAPDSAWPAPASTGSRVAVSWRAPGQPGTLDLGCEETGGVRPALFDRVVSTFLPRRHVTVPRGWRVPDSAVPILRRHGFDPVDLGDTWWQPLPLTGARWLAVALEPRSRTVLPTGQPLSALLVPHP